VSSSPIPQPQAHSSRPPSQPQNPAYLTHPEKIPAYKFLLALGNLSPKTISRLTKRQLLEASLRRLAEGYPNTSTYGFPSVPGLVEGMSFASVFPTNCACFFAVRRSCGMAATLLEYLVTRVSGGGGGGCCGVRCGTLLGAERVSSGAVGGISAETARPPAVGPPSTLRSVSMRQPPKGARGWRVFKFTYTRRSGRQSTFILREAVLYTQNAKNTATPRESRP